MPKPDFMTEEVPTNEKTKTVKPRKHRKTNLKSKGNKCEAFNINLL